MLKLMSFTNFGASQHMMLNQECLSISKQSKGSGPKECPWILEYDQMQGNEFPTISSGFPPL